MSTIAKVVPDHDHFVAIDEVGSFICSGDTQHEVVESLQQLGYSDIRIV